MNRQEFIKKIHSKSYLDKIEKKIKLLGNNSNLNVYDLLLFRLITSVIIFGVCLYTYKYGYVIAPIATVIYYFIFQDLVLDSKIKKRNSTLEKEAMHFFEVLTLSLETGRNLSDAIEVTTSNVDGLLSNEFKESIREISFGKSLSEALNDMQERIPSDTINNVILSLTQSNLYGNSILDNLSTQVDYLREKRRMEVKGKISKVPVLISIISVLIFIPLLLILILGPVLLEYL
jgi:tight adherence protein C